MAIMIGSQRFENNPTGVNPNTIFMWDFFMTKTIRN